MTTIVYYIYCRKTNMFPRDIKDIQCKTVEIYNASKKDNYDIKCLDSIKDNKEYLKQVCNDINIINDAWMEMEYVLYNQRYYITFANNYGEKHMLEESNYIMFYLGNYYVDTIDGNKNRDWIYESELCILIENLEKKQNKIKKIINEKKVLVGLELAFVKR